MSCGGLDNQRNFKAGDVFLLSVQLCKGGGEEGAKIGVETLTASLSCFYMSGKQALELTLITHKPSPTVERGFTAVTMETEGYTAPQKQHSVLECSVQM